MSTTLEKAHYNKSGRRVQFNETVETVPTPPPPAPKPKKVILSTTTTTTTTQTVQAPRSPPRPRAASVVPAAAPSSPPKEQRRSWSPLRRSRKTLINNNSNSSNSNNNNKNPSNLDTSLLSNAPSLSTAGQSTGTNTRGLPTSPRRRMWFGRSATHKNTATSPSKQRGRPPAEAAVNPRSPAHHVPTETKPLVRTLTTAATDKPKGNHNDDNNHRNNMNDPKKRTTRDIKQAEARVQQLELELIAAQKAAAQLATANLKYEQQQESLVQQLEEARQRVEAALEGKKAPAEWEHTARDGDATEDATTNHHLPPDYAAETAEELKTLRLQLNHAKRGLMAVQAENEKLRLAKQQEASERAGPKAFASQKRNGISSPSSSLSSLGQGQSSNLHDSFELQLNLQNDLARVTARVHRLEEENAMYAEKQRQMEDLLRQVDSLENANQKLVEENAALKELLEQSHLERTGQSGKTEEPLDDEGAPSHKDLVLSSSQLATATTMIGRLTEECKTLTHREQELKKQIKRLETKNKNQKEIFHTALEIKQVEMKIYEQESKLNARKVEELKQTIHDLHYQQQTATVVPVPSDDGAREERTDAADTTELKERLEQTQGRLLQAESKHVELERQIQSLQSELEERKARVAQLEETLQRQTEALKVEMEQETAKLSNHISELSSLMRVKDDELQKLHEELQDERKESEYRTQVRVNELTEQLNDYEMSLEEREERIHELEVKITQQEALLLAHRKVSPRSVTEDEETEQFSKLDEMRRKKGTYESLMRAKMNRIQEMHSNDSQDDDQPSQAPTHDSTSTREQSPPPMMVFATPVGDTRVIQMEASLRASDERIEELRAQLVDAQLRLSQVQEAAEQASDERYTDMEASLKRSDDRIKDLKEQLAQAQMRLGQAQEIRQVTKNETGVQVNLVAHSETEQDKAQYEEMYKSLQDSNEEVLHLREKLSETESKLEELHREQVEVSGDGTASHSTNDQAAATAMEEELEEFRQRYEDECDKRKTLSAQIEKLQKDRNGAMEKLQRAELDLMERQNNIEELIKELDETKAYLLDSHKHMRKNSLVPEGRVARLEAELEDAMQQIKEADMKIEMLEQFIEDETAANMDALAAASSGGTMSSFQAEADLKRKDEEMKLLRAEIDRTRKELLRSKERVENLEMERNYSTAKLKELSSIMKTKAGTEAELQLYNKCIECAELSADKDDLTNKLRASQASVYRLESEISATKQMVNDISQSWDSAASADENVVRLKKEHSESIARATTLSIELAESQMRINQLEDMLATAERTNKAFAEELNAKPGILRAIAGTGSRSSSRQKSRQNSPDRSHENAEIRRMKHRIALLEDQNAAYEASLSAFSSLHDAMQSKK